MVLEACVLCLDSSAQALDADVAPTRLLAQSEAAALVSGAKLRSNRENSIAILTLGGERVTVRVSPTNEMGVVLAALHSLDCGGTSDFVRGVQVAQLALKHRLNKNQKQRIILFIGSPVLTPEKQLSQLGKQLKKNNISLDIICLSNQDENRAKLTALHTAVNSNDTSRFLEFLSVGGQLLSEVISTSSIMRESDPNAPAEGSESAAAVGGDAQDFGVDPNADPELYLALRLSLEDERARELQQQAQQAAQQTAQPETAQMQTATNAHENAEKTMADIGEYMDEDLRQALMLSVSEYQTDGAPPDAGTSSPNANETADPNSLNAVLSGLPGVDVRDPRIQQVIEDIDQDPTPPDAERPEESK